MKKTQFYSVVKSLSPMDVSSGLSWEDVCQLLQKEEHPESLLIFRGSPVSVKQSFEIVEDTQKRVRKAEAAPAPGLKADGTPRKKPGRKPKETNGVAEHQEAAAA